MLLQLSSIFRSYSKTFIKVWDRGTSTRASSSRGTRKRERKAVKLGRASPRLVYDRSGRTSFPECPDRVSGPNRATDPARNERSDCPPARATTSPLAWSPSREHRNAGRIALSPTGRRSISYEYRCPWRYMTAWCSLKNMYRTPAYAGALSSHRGPSQNVARALGAKLVREIRDDEQARFGKC